MPESYDSTLHHVASDTIDHVAAISDPGERDRASHLWGDRLMVHIGNVAAWLFPILMVAIVTQVFIRKAGMNQAWLDDAQWWIYGSALLAGFGYAITTNSHVRVDIFHEHFADKKKARIEIFGLGWLLMPYLLMMTDFLVHYAFSSWSASEGSDSPNGLHMLYLLKILMPILFIAAVIAAYTALKRNVMKLARPTLWIMIIAGFPSAWYMAERFSHYALWWYVRFTNAEIKDRRISKDPLLDDTILYGFLIVAVLFTVSIVLTRRNSSKG